MQISYLELQKMRLINNGLAKKFPNIESTVHSLVGIQSQYHSYAIISIFNRTKNFDINDFYDNNNLIKSWGQRTTLHIYHKNDYNVISSIYKNIDNWVYKYARALGIDYKKYLVALKEYYMSSSKEIISKLELTKALPFQYSKELMQWSGLLILATYNQLLYGVINRKDEKLYSLNNAINSVNITKMSLLERYFIFYSPATINDFLHWSGLKKKDIEEELAEYLKDKLFFEIDKTKYYYSSLPTKEVTIDYPILLGKFDPLLVSYEDKKWILENKNTNLIWKSAGQIEGVILTENGLVASWHYKLKNNFIFYEVTEIKKINQKTKKQISKKFKDFNTIFDIKINKIFYLRGSR